MTHNLQVPWFCCSVGSLIAQALFSFLFAAGPKLFDLVAEVPEAAQKPVDAGAPISKFAAEALASGVGAHETGAPLVQGATAAVIAQSGSRGWGCAI